MTLKKFRQADWEEPLIFELSQKGRRGYVYPGLESDLSEDAASLEEHVPKSLQRSHFAERGL